jgi:hypothetical protein
VSDYGQGGGFGGGQPPGGGGFGGGQPPGGGGFGTPPSGGGGGQPPGGGGFGAPPSGGGFGAPPSSGGGAPGCFGAAGGGGGGGGGPLAHIPFTPEDDKNLSGMARFAMLAGITAIVGAILQAIVQIVQSIVVESPLGNAGPQVVGQVCGGVIVVAIAGLLAVFLFKASNAIKKVVETDDADQLNLIAALNALKVYFMVKGILAIVGLVLVCCLVGAAFMFGAAIAGAVGNM